MTASRARWQAPMPAHLHDSDLLQALESVTAVVQEAHDQDGYWSGESMDTVLEVLDGPLVAAARASLSEADNALSRESLKHSLQDLTALGRSASFACSMSLRPTCIQLLSDRSLPPWTIAPTRRGLIIASHSPQFWISQGGSSSHPERAERNEGFGLERGRH